MPAPPLQSHCATRHAINVNFQLDTNPKETNEHCPFIDELISKIRGHQFEGSADQDSLTAARNVSLSCRRVREILRPLASEFVKAGSIHRYADPPSLVDAVSSSISEPMWCASFGCIILALASSLSEGLVDQMGGKQTVMQASALLYGHFVAEEPSWDSLRLFFRDVSTSSRTSALFVGRLLEQAGSKDGLHAVQVVNNFAKSQQKRNERVVPQETFLRWLASFKPKLKSFEMEDLLSDISHTNDSSLVSMDRFIQVCLPQRSINAGDLKSKLSTIFSERVVGSTWLNQVIESCREKDTRQSGSVGWKEFLEVSESVGRLYTRDKAAPLNHFH